ncbi:MAG: DsbE family thiol:disulfide interchange protein [Zoogloeaceae bacterium]|jgi:cytochrome c biogenesis protein CcmG/thiol:disulfide interchange protein DsbE|nr:DsbE family thiol:disulfide interchange protein [Zoogloeaceae bacterium]
MPRNKYVWLLVAFAAFMVLLAVGLGLDAREIPSPLIDKPAPEFSLPRLDAPEGKVETFGPGDMRGKVWLLNVWATWCVACRQEHPMLMEMRQKKILPIIGLNYKDVRGDAAIDASKMTVEQEAALVRARANRWLAGQGNPYALSVLDMDGRVSIDYGVYGVPETYLIDKTGVIRFKQIGPITPETLRQELLPLIEALNR